VLYTQTGLGEAVAHTRGAQAAPNATDGTAGPNGSLQIRSARVPGAEDRWLVQPLTTPPAPPAFSAWVSHIQHGTRADENLALALDLSAIVEAANRSAATGQAVRLDALERT
jgi:hypothetical protein